MKRAYYEQCDFTGWLATLATITTNAQPATLLLLQLAPYTMMSCRLSAARLQLQLSGRELLVAPTWRSCMPCKRCSC
jgi:hypothetical protein